MAGEAITVTPAPAPAGNAPFSIPTLPVDLSQEAEIRAIANAAETAGENVVPVPQKGTQTPTAEPPKVQQGQPTPPAAQTPNDVPAKFLKPDGTVDVEKLQASSKQLDTAIEQKTLSIEEMIAQYKAKEAAFRNLPKAPEQVARMAQQMAAPATVPLPMPPPAAPADPASIQAQLVQDLNRDPVGTIVDLVKAINSMENKPLHEFVNGIREQQKDESMKGRLADLAKDDPRIANPVIYQHLLAELDSDPAYFSLKNPYKAAWNEVKGKLRLGDVQSPAQPSKTASPILGGGSPPPVPSTTGALAPATLQGAIGQMKTKDEIAMVEDELRKLSQSTQW